MVTTRLRTLDRPSARAPSPPFPILESKLAPPLGRDGMVPRKELLSRLETASGVPVVAVTAPLGYGKSTLLVQWAEQDARTFVWLSIDGRDNDPVVLLTYIAMALDRSEPIDRAVFRALASPGAPIMETVLPLLGSALSSRTLPVVMVLDDAHLLRNGECIDHVGALVDHLPIGSQLAIAGRGESPLPLGRLRAEGRVVEIGADDLAMDQSEAASLLRGADVEVSEAHCAELNRRTEGWPVALYLAALSLQMGGSGNGGIALDGDDRFLVDYLQSVLLSRLPAESVSVLTRTSVLERLSGPLCDAVLDRTGSADLLESLERSNLLLIPLDRRRRWYRYHHLFRELLRAKLDRGEPGAAGELLLRAAAWCEDNGLPEAAIEYAMQAGDTDRVARLVANAAFLMYRTGRLATVQRWFDWFDENGEIEQYSGLAVIGAWYHLVVGNLAASERWAEAAQRGSLEGTLPDGSTSIEGWLALRRALLCPHGMEQARRDAEFAAKLLPLDSLMRAPALLVLGMAHLGAGAPEQADDILADTVEVAEDAGATVAAVDALAERAILAMRREDWHEAEILVEQARGVIREARLDDYVTTILLYAAAARVAIHRGDVPPALEHLARAQGLRPQMTHALPFYAVQTRLELIRAYIALTDVAGARTVLREVDDLLRRHADLGILGSEADELRSQLETMRADVIGASSLTAAELRLLPLLATHHSFRELGERLHLSPHTVKTQAIAIYRKLGVSSRSQAIQHAQDLGLLVT
jgi:LuxR family transcriptional regulator, maltose regulon positive regulatory protein